MILEVTDLNLNKIGAITNVWNAEQEDVLNGAGSLKFSMVLEALNIETLDVEPNKQVEWIRHHTFIRVMEDDRYIFTGIPSTIEKEEMEHGELVAHVQCYGAMAWFTRFNVRNRKYTNTHPRDIVKDLLGLQSLIQMGNIEATQPITIEFSYEDLMTALFKLVEILGGDMYVDPHNMTLNWVNQLGGTGPEIRYQRNMRFIRIKSENAAHFTRIIPLGYGEGINQLTIKSVNDGKDYLDADTIEEYGVIEFAWANKEIKDAATLKRAAQKLLDEHKYPTLAYETDMIDLSEWEDEWGERPYKDSRPRLGDWMRIYHPRLGVDIRERVIKIIRPLDEDKRHQIKLELSQTRRTYADIIRDMNRNIESFRYYDQGNTFISSYTLADNIDSGFPARMMVYIDPKVININYAKLSFYPRKYRGFTKAIQGGGGTTVTSGPSSRTTSAAGGDHYHMVFKYADSSPPSLTSREYFAYIPGQAGAFSMALPVAQSGDIYTYESSGDHTHNMDHTHNITIPEHTHPIEFGIFEGPDPATVTVKVNGNEVASSNTERRDIEIRDYLKTGQWNTVEFSCSGLARVEAVLNIQQFIQTV